MIHKMIAAAALAVTLSAGPTFSAMETHNLSQYKDWLLRVEVYDGNDMACAVRTTNWKGQTFDVTIHDNGSIQLYMFFPGANFRGEYLDMYLDIDYSRWTLYDAEFVDNMVTFTFEPNGPWVQFLSQLQRGQAVAIKSMTGSGETLTTWSLRGSARIIDQMIDCVKRITATGA